MATIVRHDGRVVEWVPDFQVSDCLNCRAEFTFFNRRHHCRYCGQIFCSACASIFYPYRTQRGIEDIRVCSKCYDLLQSEGRPSTAQWTARPNLITARERFGAVCLDRHLFVVGGQAADGSKVAFCEKYFPGTGQWSPIANLPTPRSTLAVVVCRNRIYAIGGSEGKKRHSSVVEVYDSLANEWAAKAPLPNGRDNLGAASLGGKVFAMGGWESGLKISSRCDCFDPDSGAWSQCANMPIACTNFGVAVYNNHIYCFGGAVESGLTDVIQVFSPSKNQWKLYKKAVLPSPRELSPSVAVIDGRAILIGGCGGSGQLRMAECQSLDINAGVWRRENPMAVPLARMDTVLLGGHIYVLGGVSPQGTSSAAVSVCLNGAQAAAQAQREEQELGSQEAFWAPLQMWLHTSSYSLLANDKASVASWRPQSQKRYIMLNTVDSVREVRLMYLIPQKFKNERDRGKLSKFVTSAKHPYLLPATSTEYLSSGHLVLIRNWMPAGNIKQMCEGRPLEVKQIAKFGRMILEALCFLRTKSHPHTHFHASNVLVDKTFVRVTNYENAVLKIPAKLSVFHCQWPHVEKDVMGFLHVLYCMVHGMEPQLQHFAECTSPNDTVCPPQVAEIFDLVFSSTATPVTVEDLLQLPLYCLAKVTRLKRANSFVQEASVQAATQLMLPAPPPPAPEADDDEPADANSAKMTPLASGGGGGGGNPLMSQLNAKLTARRATVAEEPDSDDGFSD